MAICNIRLFTEDFFYLSLYKNTFINLIVLFANKGTFFIFYCIFVCHELNSNQMDYEDLNYFFISLFSLPLVLNAQSVDEMLQKVSAAIEAGQNGQAVSYFRQTIALNIDRTEMYYWTNVDKNSEISSKLATELALAYKKNRNYDKAYLFYKELLQKTPNNVDCLEACAEMQVCRGQEKDALRMYEKILQLEADNLAANIFLGNYYYLTAEQEKKKLEMDYKKLSSPTKMQYARYRDGLSKLFTTQYEKARNSLQKVILRFPSTEAQKTLDKILRIEKR